MKIEDLVEILCLIIHCMNSQNTTGFYSFSLLKILSITVKNVQYFSVKFCLM